MRSEFEREGGTPITPEMAIELREVVFGTAALPMRAEWIQTPFAFGPEGDELPYGLRSPRNATRGLLSVVQGFMLKYLLFQRKTSRAANLKDPLNASSDVRTTALISAMVEILRMISDKGKIIMVLPSGDDESFVPHSASYFHDSITEKLYVFSLSPHDEVEFFIKRHYENFTETDAPGALLFLYSAVLTRTLGKIRTDLDSRKNVPLTITNNEEGSLMIVTLLLTGRATPYIHNGVINVGDENSYAVPQYGILSRCTIGLLIWDNDSSQGPSGSARQPGSRLKTPNYPIWVTNCSGHFGVIFNKNADLLRNYHAESYFELFYYSCSGHQIAMTIDNRTFNEQGARTLERQSSSAGDNSLSGRSAKDELKNTSGSSSSGGGGVGSGSGTGGGPNASEIASGTDAIGKDDSTTVCTPLQRLIHTKWEEAHIRYHVQPSMLGYLFSTLAQ